MSSHVTIVINPFTGTFFLIDHDPPNTEGPSPASDEAIKPLPMAKIKEHCLECSICLAEYEVGTDAKEMACRHKFHEVCVNKWLKVNGSCPVCQFRLPEKMVENKETKEDESDPGTEMSIRFVNAEMVTDHAVSCCSFYRKRRLVYRVVPLLQYMEF